MMPLKEHTSDQDRYYLSMAALIADAQMGVTCDADQDMEEIKTARAVKEIGGTLINFLI